jgi:hypothetical protein
MKNALDWLVSCPDFAGKPVLLWNASAAGGQWAQASLVETLTTMAARVLVEASLIEPFLHRKLQHGEEPTDEGTVRVQGAGTGRGGSSKSWAWWAPRVLQDTPAPLGFRPSTPRSSPGELLGTRVFAGVLSLGTDDARPVHVRPPQHKDCSWITSRETTKAAIYRFPV